MFFLRTMLNKNVHPAKDAIRIEELINCFPYDYPAPDNLQQPFKTTVSVLPCSWNPIMHIGIKGYQHSQQTRPHAKLVFLIDASDSMTDANKLSQVQPTLKMLLETLNTEDSVAIVTNADTINLVLETTKVKDKAKIITVIDNSPILRRNVFGVAGC